MKQGSGGIEDGGPFASYLDADVNLLEVYELRLDLRDVTRRRGVEISLTDERTELVGLDL